MSILTVLVWNDTKLLQRSTTCLHKGPEILPGIVPEILDGDFAEPWFEKDNTFEYLLWRREPRNNRRAQLSLLVGWHNAITRLARLVIHTITPWEGGADGRDGKVVQAREMAVDGQRYTATPSE